MIDFHSHILPKIDDGPENMEETIKMIKEAKLAGFDGIISTSHYLEGYYTASKAERTMLLEGIKSKINDEKIPINLYLGSEIYISNDIYELLSDEKASSISDTSYVLFELPFNAKPLNLYDVIYDLLQYKLIPILAHPERYPFVHDNPEIVYELINKGVLMQANYGSFIGQYGKKTKIIAKKLIENNLIHFLGSDVHSVGSVYSKIPRCRQCIKEIIGEDKFDIISTVNPELVLNNKKINIPEPKKIKFSLAEKILLKML